MEELIGSIVGDVLDTVCKVCGGRGTIVHGPHPGGHYAKIDCSKCGRWIRWLPKPDVEKHRRPAAHRDLVEKFGKGFCELCLRKKDQLPLPQTLIGHHVDPYAKSRNKELKKEDVWILCTMCHRIVEWMRTYMGHYHNEHSELSEDTGLAEGA